MAIEKVIDIQVKSNVEGSISELKSLKRQLKDTAAGSDEFKKLFNQIDDLEDKIKSSKNASSDWIDSLEQAGGPLGMVGAALNRAKVATQSFGGALKATGIGLFVSLIGGLVAAFSENEGAMKKIQPLIDGLKKAFQGVFRAVEPLFNTMVDLATEALPYVTKGIGTVYSAMMAYFTFLKEAGGGAMKVLKGIFTLDADAISEGIDQVGGSFKKTQQSYNDSLKRFSEGSKELTQAEKDEAEKREANRKAALEKKQANEEKAKEKAIQKAKEEADALQKLKDEADKEAIRQGESFRDKLEEAEKAERDAKKANADALLTEQQLAIQTENEAYEIKKANAIKFGTDYQEIERQHLNELNNINLTAQEKQYAEDKLASDKKLADAKEAADKQIAVEKALTDAKRNALDTGLGLLQQFAGKNKNVALSILAIQKGLAIADVVVGATKAIGLAKASMAPTPLNPAFLGPGIPNPSFLLNLKVGAASILATKIAAGTSIASILAAGITSAASISGGGASSSAAGGGGGGGGTATPTPPSFNVVGAAGTNQLAQSIGAQQQQPIQTYVVANNITTAQSLQRNIIESATIGG